MVLRILSFFFSRPAALAGRSRSLWRVLLLTLMALGLGEARAQVVISQVYGGGGNSGAALSHDFVELHNNGLGSTDLAGWSLQYTSATGTSWGSQKTLLNGVLPPGGYLLVQLASGGANGVALPTPDLIGVTNMSATAGKIALVNSTVSLASLACPSDASIVDLVGYGNTANCHELGQAPAPSNALALQRAGQGCTDTQNNGADFTTATPAPRSSASATVSCSADQPIVASCTSFNTVLGIAGSSLISATDPDGLVNGASITGGALPELTLGTLTPALAIGGTASVRVEAGAALAAGAHAITVTFTNGDGQSTPCNLTVTTLNPPAVLTAVASIQGPGTASPLTGQSVTTRGVVTAVMPGLLGYYLQDETGDVDPLTSEGLFVYQGSTSLPVSAGERVQVTGNVSEFAGFGGDPTITELTAPSSVAKLGLGSIPPTQITLPEAADGDLERFEGMLVQIPGPLTASQNFFQGRYGQVTLSSGGRLIKPTNIHRPGTPGAVAAAADNARRRIVLDDGRSAENFFSGVENPNPVPYIGMDTTLRAGDTVTNLVGIVDFGRITNATGADAIVDYKLHPVLPPLFTRVNQRAATPPSPGGTHRVASFNVLNYFTTFGNGATAAGGSGQGCLPSNTTSDCRGADNATEFTRQRDKIIRAIAALDADVVGLMEIQRNGGVAAQDLVDGLNAFLGDSVYAPVTDPANVGTDAIQVAMIYKPARLTLTGAALSDTSVIHDRPPVAQTFQAAGGAKFSVVVNHFKSKNCGDATGLDLDQGDGQGCYNERRRQQSTALLAFVDSVRTAAADDDVIVIGDLNAYGQEDPVDLLVSGGLQDQIARFDGSSAYTFVFDGEAGYLDHALATAPMASQISGTVHWRINADEPSVIDYNTEFKPQDLYAVSPYRSSDHDPVLIGLSLPLPPATQTITFAQPANAYLDESTISLSASASSGLPVVFTSQSAAVCTVSGSTVQLLLAGLCTVAADQPGNASFLPAPQIIRHVTIHSARTPQSIHFVGIAAQIIGDPPVSITVAASSGLPVTVTSLTPAVCQMAGAAVTLLATGLCELSAQQAGDSQFAPAAPVARSFSVMTAAEYGDVPIPLWALAALAGTLLGTGYRVRRARAAAKAPTAC